MEPELVPLDADPELGALSRLARQSLQGDSRRDAASFARVEAKVVERQRRRRRTARGLAVAASLSVAAAVAVFITQTRALTYQVVNGAVVDGSRIVGGPSTEVRFSDGSELTLAPGAQTHIAALDSHGGKVSLEEGGAKVKIAKRPGAAWTLGAGPYSVLVTGTAFSLNWSKRDQAFEIAMQSGSVVVTGPLIGSGIALHAGQRLRSAVAGGRLVVEDIAPGSPKEAPAAVATTPTVNTPPVVPGASTPPAAADALPSGELDWRKKAAEGAFAEVIAAAERRGLDATLSSVSLADLTALADSARYARRLPLAKRALLAARSRFPKSHSARDAAFFLGRIAEDEGGGAVEWYDRYLMESKEGAYASQALGRKMMLVYQQRGADSARAVAAEYLTRFPNGSYAATAKKIGASLRDKSE
jgi:TolA-binding protein